MVPFDSALRAALIELLVGYVKISSKKPLVSPLHFLGKSWHYLTKMKRNGEKNGRFAFLRPRKPLDLETNF
jgi:hypothetical protein